MAIGKKLAVAVVVFGVLVALAFYKGAPWSFCQAGRDDPFADRVERRVTTDAAWARRSSSARPTGPATRVPAAATAAIAPSSDLAPEGQPAFQKNFNPVGALLAPIEGVVDDAERWDGSLESDVEPSAALSARGATARHVVVDGDTLSSLAVRYLGRAEDYLRIFDFNRDVLASPDLLPIGAVLKIPPRRSGSIPSTLSDGELDSAQPLVPVPDRTQASTR